VPDSFIPASERCTDIAAGFAQDQIVAGVAVPLTFDHLAALLLPRRQLPAGALLMPRVGPGFVWGSCDE